MLAAIGGTAAPAPPSAHILGVRSSGAYSTSYDIWDTGHQYEIALWVDRCG
ncbi:hypothetical protein [Streptomyces europaeiscabiei]|uniref:Uncharacterized protein n=1 Tax=Streptomyces europaeiscabiei TaxID=146819 RepID=A0ABU4NQ26_9ACTN|nr:hypothetical protein [Streptomyces europaeiscabiei]MDX2526153.1 hypothetical protein [Streptomyces europaeiscabiei]MDX2759366.1 hypothetical protein [Streptomyces europaeiscabiei]MDX3547587.1 hypothetical protein [Streptomyces europaeiscabiei]MDX3557064.1 hypothetical protein [Streptomyces europaeiscabiei]MDX3665996.1 hypothetical protein [Streptomyces europaeiscabiei]